MEGSGPERDLVRWRDDLSRFFENPFQLLRGALTELTGPSVEVLESGPDLLVRAELPGVRADQLDVRVTERTVVVRGEVQRDQRQESDGYYHTERRFGSFYRTVALPVEVEAGAARAAYRDGLLEIRMPKKSPDPIRGRRVPIETDPEPRS